MDLQKFITQSLVEIMNGLKDAQHTLKDSNSEICPTINTASDGAWGGKGIHGWSTKDQAVATIDYDIAVEVTNEGHGGGKINVVAGLTRLRQLEGLKSASD
jgi:hypothetical protein